MKRKLLLIADCAVSTGFAQVSHNLIKQLHNDWDIHVLAINYYGDYHSIQEYCRLYAPTAKVIGDVYGLSRVTELLNEVKPDTLLMINDPWVAINYQMLKDVNIRRVLYTPIDAMNIKRQFVEPLSTLFDHIVTYTEFGKQQLQKRGLALPISIITHGVDTDVFYPIDKEEARSFSNIPNNWYIVQEVNRNAPRKGVALAFYYFAKWVQRYNKPDTVKFHYHGALRDEGNDLVQLDEYFAEDFNIGSRLILTATNITPSKGIPIELMHKVYNIADVGFTCTFGEGFGLTIAERMACKIPMIVPFHSALAEWPQNGVYHTDVSEIPMFTHKGLNTHQSIPDMDSCIDALEYLYHNRAARLQLAEKGYNLITQDTFKWNTIAKQFHTVLMGD